MATSLECPNCGAPLDYKGRNATMRCPYCHTSVVVPEELRKHNTETVVQMVYNDKVSSQKGRGGAGIVWILLVVIALIVIVSAVVPLIAAAGVTSAVLGSVSNLQPTRAVPVINNTSTPIPSPTTQPTATPTPAFANPVLTFGAEGTGPGQFSDARHIAVDGQGILYIADYQGGRVQAFDATGKYLAQWRVGGEKAIIHGLAASYQGNVFVAYGGDVIAYSGTSGEEVGRMSNPLGGDFGSLAASADGGLAGVWYEGRWGMITSLEGHREDLVIFDRSGQINRTIPSLISTQTESPALDVSIAVDGAGNIFALEEGWVYRFGPDGKFVDRFGGNGNQAGRAGGAYSIAVDGQGRVYLGGSRSIDVFDANGSYLDSFSIENSAFALAVDYQGGIWVLSRQTVTQYGLK